MFMNWNPNDTKYILKKVIVLLLSMFAIFIIGTWKANAMTFNKPKWSTLALRDTQDPNSFSYLRNDNINNLIFLDNYRYWELQQYNDTQRLADNYIVYDWLPDYDNEYRIITFRYAFDVNLQGDVQDLDVNAFYVGYTVDGVDSYTECGVMSRSYVQRLTNVTTAIYSVKCVTNGLTLKNLTVRFRPLLNNYYDRKFFINENIEVRLPASQEDLQQALDDVLQGIAYQQSWLENAYTGNADTDFTSNIFNSPLFDDNTGLQSVITLPLSMINNLTSTCQPVTLPLPFVNGNVTLPCMSTIYQQHFSSLYSVISVIVNGFFVYRILLKIYELVHDAKDPAKDKLEVVEL